MPSMDSDQIGRVQTVDPISHDKLDGALTWAAAGFTALAGLLTFFGLKEGTLDQSLRLYPAATICVFVLLGLGVVATLFAKAIHPGSRLRVWALIAAIILMLLCASVFLPNLGDASRLGPQSAAEIDTPWHVTFGPWITAVLLVPVLVLALYAGWRFSIVGDVGAAVGLGGLSLLLAGASLFFVLPRKVDSVKMVSGGIDWQRTASVGLAFVLVLLLLALMMVALISRWAISTMAGLTILAVTATSLGLYGATKVAVESKNLTVRPRVEASVETSAEGSKLSVSVKASRLRDQRLVVEVLGTPRATANRSVSDAAPTSSSDIRVWSGVLQPDALDEVDRVVALEIVPSRWQDLRVRYCRVSDDQVAPTCDKAVATLTTAVVHSPAPEAGMQQIGASFKSTENGRVKATFSASDVAPGVLTRLELCRLSQDGTHISHMAEVTLMPDDHGNIVWEDTLKAGAIGDQVILRHMSCPPGSPCAEAWEQLAAYVIE
jgi:hypothetical protein